MSPAPRLLVGAGLHRSASTWAANAMADLLRCDAPTGLVYAETPNEVEREIGAARQAAVEMHPPEWLRADPPALRYAAAARVRGRTDRDHLGVLIPENIARFRIAGR